MGASAGEKNQFAMGRQSISDYLNTFAPIETTVARDLQSTSGNQVEAGRANVDNNMAWSAAQQEALAQELQTGAAPGSGAMVAKVLDASRKRGAASGLQRVQTAQNQQTRRIGGLRTGPQVGRGLTNITTGSMRNSDQVSQALMMEREARKAEREAQIYGVVGTVTGVGLGAAAQGMERKVPGPDKLPTAAPGTKYSLLEPAPQPSPYSLRTTGLSPSPYSLNRSYP